MANNTIVVVTDNHYFAHGVMSVLTDDERRHCSVRTPAWVSVNINKIDAAVAETLWIIDVDNYFNNTLLYFDILTTLLDIKIQSDRALRVLLCYNRSVCMPSLACYSLFSLVNAAHGVKGVAQKVKTLFESDQKGTKGVKSREKTALTRAEFLVLNALSQGQNVNQVACRYHITPKRVSHHKCSGLNKMKKKRLYGVYGE